MEWDEIFFAFDLFLRLLKRIAVGFIPVSRSKVVYISDYFHLDN